MDRATIQGKIESALQLLVEVDLYLLEVDANERSLTHKLAQHLDSQFPDYHVDCEYNRDDDDPKRIIACLGGSTTSVEDTNAKTVFPDIIVHKRGESGPNILVVEVKKNATSEARKRDICKLRQIKKKFTYQYAGFINLRTGKKPGYKLEFVE